MSMDVLYPDCAGMDVHKKTVVVTVQHRPPGSVRPTKETRTFNTFTPDLLTMHTWLAEQKVTHVAMEATGSYWKPVYNVLEGSFTTWVVEPSSIKNMPGRKTDVRDSEWITDLLQHGLLRPSFIPDRPQRELRELIHYRLSVIRERAREVNRVQKLLEGANIKLGSVLSDVLGVSGRTMLKALARGETDPQRLAELADPRVRASAETLVGALTGMLGDHQRFMLRMQLDHIDQLELQIAALDQEVAERLRPFEAEQRLLETIHGVKGRAAEMILARVGANVDPFRSAAALAKWSGLAPGNKVSGGKRLSGRTHPGDPDLRSAMVEAAWAATRTKNTYLAAQYHRLAPRLGKKKALMAVAHSIIVRVWVVLKRHAPYEDLGGDYFDQRDRNRVVRRSVNRLVALGYRVTLEESA
ncbi:MAG: IS110 family transposase [Thermaerobacter sp.]|nr:IS110 family transposase [Thermaerobacter sp.]